MQLQLEKFLRTWGKANMKLKELLGKIQTELTIPDSANLEQEVTGVSTNSQKIEKGYLFLGLPGSKVDGGQFWLDSIKAGAVAAIVTPSSASNFPAQAGECLIQSGSIENACAEIAAAFYGFPAKKLKMIAVTGTNGKTTTTHLIEYFLEQAHKSTALLGTLYTRWPGYQKTALHTTPFAVELQEQLFQAQQAGCQYAVMEASSHALAQGRIKQCAFDVAIFSNLTQDHLDYHQNMEDYFQAKALLFTPEFLKGKAIVNIDDSYGQRLVDSLPADKVWTYSLSNQQADFYSKDLNYKSNGVSGTLVTPRGSFAFDSPLVGQFNLANLLSAVAALSYLNISSQILDHLPNFAGVPGRMERVNIDPKQDISVIVDYAHTPDSLENLLKAARPFIAGKMICVFGCGGDRDRTKRPLMGKIATTLADYSIVTSDNPRTEDPQRILDDIVQGLADGANFEVIADRAQAIAQAIGKAQSGDGILIAGKGHEDYQILGTEKIHFDDRLEAAKALKARLKY